MEFVPFGKIPRLSREIVVTEKIDGTNAAVQVIDVTNSTVALPGPLDVVRDRDGHVFAIYAQSRSRLITPQDDNHGFARWVRDHALELARLGPGVHFGEWWGSGINRGYGLRNGEKRFSLFNSGRWVSAHKIADAPPCFELKEPFEVAPLCCDVVPILYQGGFSQDEIEACIAGLTFDGSKAEPGYTNPEGIVIYHTAARQYFKKTILKDDEWKGKVAA